ncbi:MAG: hypothetical protein ACI9SF_000781, partial [Candidatus Nanohaloarchaea archaeon]
MSVRGKSGSRSSLQEIRLEIRDILKWIGDNGLNGNADESLETEIRKYFNISEQVGRITEEEKQTGYKIFNTYLNHLEKGHVNNAKNAGEKMNEIDPELGTTLVYGL